MYLKNPGASARLFRRLGERRSSIVSYKTFIACYKEDIVKFVALIAVVAVVVVLFH